MDTKEICVNCGHPKAEHDFSYGDCFCGHIGPEREGQGVDICGCSEFISERSVAIA